LNKSLTPSLKEKFKITEYVFSIVQITPVFFLILIILGSIYLGWATPSEAAAVGVAISLLFALVSKSMNFEKFISVLKNTVKTSSMILLIICGASYLSAALGNLAIPYRITTYISALSLSPFSIILILVLIYVILGCLIDGISIIVMTCPIVLPIIHLYGFDTLWFGIFVIILICISNITPPLGFNLFILMGITNEELWFVAKACLPFFIIMLLNIMILYVFPDIVTFLPRLMIN
jgi:tripartite ATP-independent transporter DctM subunit